MFELMLFNGRDNSSQVQFLSAGPTAKRGASLAVRDGVIYHSGGTDVNGINSNKLHGYNIDTGEWTEIATIPRAVTNHRSIVFGNILYILGGNSTNLANSYNLDTGVWTTLTNIPFSAESFALVSTDSEIYIFSNDNYLYRMQNKSTGAWVVNSTGWTTRRQMATATIGAEMYLHSGRVGTGAAINDRYRVNVVNGSGWTSIALAPTNPTPRINAKMVASGNNLYMFGGETVAGTIFEDVWHWSLPTNVWKKTAIKIPARRNIDSVIVNGDIYICGGITQENTTAEGWMKITL